MARDDHQPWPEEPERPERTPDDMRKMCGRTVAFILALGQDAGDIGGAIACARKARVAAAYVFAKPVFAPQAVEAVRLSGKKGQTLVQAIEYDPGVAVGMTRDAGNFELFSQLPYGLLETMRVVAAGSLDDYEAVVVLDAEQDRITPDHVYELMSDAREHPEAEVVVSWIQWLRRMPCVVTRTFLERLERRDAALLGSGFGSSRPTPRLAVRDHVFGEEKLAAAASEPKMVADFLGSCTMSALQAVDLAKYANEHPDEELHSPNQPRSLMGPAKAEPLCDADKLLVKAVGDVVAARGGLSADEAAELAWADAFGQRNKCDFPLLNDREHAGKLAYLDSAATSQRVDVALQAQADWDAHENANVYRGAYELSANATFAFNDARKRLEDFIGADRRLTAYTANATGGLNLVAQAWGTHHIGEGDLIVCELAAHHANSLPFLMLAQRVGARVEHIPYDESGRIDQTAYAELLAQRPKLVCLAQVGNVFGIQAPVKQMAAAAHEAGARVVVDAAQSFPHMKIDVNDLGADWVAFSAHKACGPMGIGALWMAPDAFDEMDPISGGGGIVSHVATDAYYLRPKSLQYEPGTPPVSQAIGWAAAIDYLDALGMDNVARHSAALTRYAAQGLQRIDGVTVIGDHSQPDGQMGLVSFTVRSVAPAAVAKFLGQLGVAIRAGGHCALPLHAALGVIGSGRISIGVHTTRADIDAALAAIALCRKTYES